ncbi:MAG TPA: hypothetical protein VG866_02705, partial [Candidatus Paceibacterota bacterium]|nr:hypothetical protein [Candidatus Paceibacterota bacterium]
ATQNGDIAPIDFLSELYQDGGKIFFDGVGFHPYSYPALPSYTQAWNAWSQMNDTNPSLRGIMSANGDSSKKIWLTEFGAPTNGPGITASVDDARLYQSPDHVTEDLQAKMVTDAARLAQGYSWAGPLFFFTYKDTGTASNSIENFFGLVRYDGSKKPAYDALEQVLAK